MMQFLGKVSRFISEKELIPPKGKVLITLSGGADSVALLYVLKELGYELIATHCNFHLRGEEANRDELFVKKLCKKLDVTCFFVDFQTTTYAQENQVSIEMAARELRYKWFDELAKEQNCDVIAVAHHSNDNVETLLLNMVRGTGLRGLVGIPFQRDNIVRPLLCVTRAEIKDYLQEKQQRFVTDSTNLETDYQRNKIRLSVLPLLQTINPSVDHSLLKMADNLSEINLGVERIITKETPSIYLDTNRISLPVLQQTTFPKTLLFYELNRYGFNRSQVEKIYHLDESISGKIFYSKEYCIEKNRDQLILSVLKDSISWSKKIEANVQQITSPDGLHSLSISSVFRRTKDWKIPMEKNKVAIDADKLSFPLVWRTIEKGERFQPLGMKGKKNLSDYFTDKKWNYQQKREATVLSMGDEIIWLIGERLDHRFRITNQTKNIIEFIYF